MKRPVRLVLLVSFFVACDGTDGSLAEKHDKAGQQKVMSSDFAGAIKDYDAAIRYNPKDGFIYFNRGAAKLNLGDYDGAIADFTRVIELEPKLRSHAYKARGQAKQLKGDATGAGQDFVKQYTGE